MNRVGDALAGFIDGFAEALAEHFDRHKDLLDDLGYEEARRYGHEAAASAVAPVVWAEIVGERWDTSTTAEFLGVSRQALHDRLKRGTLLGLPGRGTTWFPTWQFDLTAHAVRPVVARILAAFAETLGQKPDPLMVASWASGPKAGLDGLAPVDWIAAPGRDDQALVAMARRSAAQLAA